MLNQIVVIGRIKYEPKKEKDKLFITLSVPATVKNENGCYPVDEIECTLTGTIAEQVYKYCNVHDVVGIRGRIQRRDDNPMEIIAEKVTFLSSKTYE